MSKLYIRHLSTYAYVDTHPLDELHFLSGNICVQLTMISITTITYSN